MGLNQVVSLQSKNTIHKNHSTGYKKEVVSMSQRHKARLGMNFPVQQSTTHAIYTCKAH